MEIIKNFKTDKNALTLPWTESPFFYDLLESSENHLYPLEVNAV
jgi:hypothetical protein